jgi:transposase
METAQLIAKRYHSIEWALDERLRRLFVASEALALGYGGVSIVAAQTGVSRGTIHAGLNEIKNRSVPSTIIDGLVRKPGGGRKRTTTIDESLLYDLNVLIEPTTRGDPESPLRWTSKSLRHLADELNRQGHQTSHRMVGELLHELGYSLQANSKTLEGASHPDRNAQFEYINTQVKKRIKAGSPVISVDTKKKELVGDFKNNGRELCPVGEPEKVRVHDFIIPELGRANPYGIYDLSNNTGWVSVGVDHDTATFAVESIRRWWYSMGKTVYPKTQEIMITADSGGSNGSRVRLWKVELQQLANELGCSITVCHFPSGTSKWNKIEHRLFSFITQNWRSKPLISYEVIISLIQGTTTEKGLRIQCALDENIYPKGIKITDDELLNVNLKSHNFHGEWNYTIKPNSK